MKLKEIILADKKNGGIKSVIDKDIDIDNITYIALIDEMGVFNVYLKTGEIMSYDGEPN